MYDHLAVGLLLSCVRMTCTGYLRGFTASCVEDDLPSAWSGVECHQRSEISPNFEKSVTHGFAHTIRSSRSRTFILLKHIPNIVEDSAHRFPGS